MQKVSLGLEIFLGVLKMEGISNLKHRAMMYFEGSERFFVKKCRSFTVKKSGQLGEWQEKRINREKILFQLQFWSNRKQH